MSLKLKYQLEFPIRASINRLYQYISSPSEMSEWFADEVNFNSKEGVYIFTWEGEEEIAKVLTKNKNDSIKFKWEEDEQSDSYFEFKIVQDEITKDISLFVTDFAEEDEIEEAKDLWESQIDGLKKILGA
ncbi:MAG: SRPBCC domain-containing protein [Flavobacteriaceae bacterium]|nr:SRPBCC domain-containing protein [Flavobacteriaceae bacterium]